MNEWIIESQSESSNETSGVSFLFYGRTFNWSLDLVGMITCVARENLEAVVASHQVKWVKAPVRLHVHYLRLGFVQELLLAVQVWCYVANTTWESWVIFLSVIAPKVHPIVFNFVHLSLFILTLVWSFSIIISQDDGDVCLIQTNNCILTLAVLAQCLGMCFDWEGEEECIGALNLAADIMFCCVSACMTAQTNHEINHRENLNPPASMEMTR